MTALFPNWPNPKDLRDAFGRSGYRLQYSLQATAPPVIETDSAHVSARRIIDTPAQLGNKATHSETNVTVSLQKIQGRWVITSIR